MKGHVSSFSETGYPRRCKLIEQLLNEEVQLISTVLECDSPDRRDRLCVYKKTAADSGQTGHRNRALVISDSALSK